MALHINPDDEFATNWIIKYPRGSIFGVAFSPPPETPPAEDPERINNPICCLKGIDSVIIAG